METLKQIADAPAVSVFLGTLPLLAAIIWGLLQNDRRLGRIETKLDSIDASLINVRERLVKVETKIEGPHLVTH